MWYTDTHWIFLLLDFLQVKYFVLVSVVIVRMLARDNVWFLCSPKPAVCQVPSGQAPSWADILTSV